MYMYSLGFWFILGRQHVRSRKSTTSRRNRKYLDNKKSRNRSRISHSSRRDRTPSDRYATSSSASEESVEESDDRSRSHRTSRHECTSRRDRTSSDRYASSSSASEDSAEKMERAILVLVFCVITANCLSLKNDIGILRHGTILTCFRNKQKTCGERRKRTQEVHRESLESVPAWSSFQSESMQLLR